MKRIVIHLSIGLLTFAFGVALHSLWKVIGQRANTRADIKVSQASVGSNRRTAVPDVPSPTIPPSPDLEVVFGNGLRMVPREINLENDSLRYQIHVVYPQIQGPKDKRILKLNQRIKQLAIESYTWALHPTKEDLRYYRESHPDAFNTVDLNYEICLATDSLLSIYFIGYSYGIGAAHSVQFSLVINYDLKSGKHLKLADVFKPGEKYLQFLSSYCTKELSEKFGGTDFIFTKEPAPRASNYKSWNLTKEWILFNFDACKVSSCADGNQSVEIPFADLKELLNPNTSVAKLI